MQDHVRPGDELQYLFRAAERFAPDAIQVDQGLRTWVDVLGEEDFAKLACVYNRAAAADHMSLAARELDPTRPVSEARKRRLFLLFLLFDHLGEQGIKPFDSFLVGHRALPECQVDWTELPEDLRWIIKPAEQYGSLEFEARILDHISAMGDAERVEARRLRARFSAHRARIEEVGENGPLRPRTPASLIYNLSMFFAYLHSVESGDLPNSRDWERWANEWKGG